MSITASITFVSNKKPSRNGGYYYLVCFKTCPDSRALRSYVDPDCRNFSRWREVFAKFQEGKPVTLTGLVEKGDPNLGLINADSFFEEVTSDTKED